MERHDDSPPTPTFDDLLQTMEWINNRHHAARERVEAHVALCDVCRNKEDGDYPRLCPEGIYLTRRWEAFEVEYHLNELAFWLGEEIVQKYPAPEGAPIGSEAACAWSQLWDQEEERIKQHRERLVRAVYRFAKLNINTERRIT